MHISSMFWGCSTQRRSAATSRTRTARTLVREPDAGNPPVRFDERGVKTEHGRRILRHNRGNPETEVSRSLNHRVTPRLYLPRTSSARLEPRDSAFPGRTWERDRDDLANETRR